jgi:Tfp pilus assembly protein PilF
MDRRVPNAPRGRGGAFGAVPGASGTSFDHPAFRSAALVVAALSLLVYLNAFAGEFVFDDDSLIRDNPLVTDRGRMASIFLGPDGRPTYRPVRTFTYALDHLLWDANPAGYHLSNVLYHAAASLMVFVIAALLGLPHRAALLAAAVFAVHPVHTDAVTYISGRRDVVSSFFYLAAFACFLADRRRPGGVKVAGVFVLYMLGIFTKEMAATLPVVCVAYHLTWGAGRAGSGPEGPAGGLRPPSGETGRGKFFYGALLLAGACYAYYAVKLQPAVTLRRDWHGGSAWLTALTMTRVFWAYVWLLVWPARLCADYSFDAFPISGGLAEPRTLLAAAGVAAAGLLPFWLARRRPEAAFALFWHWLTLGPVSQIVPHWEMMAEHYLYLPSAAICVAAGVALDRVAARWRAGGAVAAACVLLSMSVRTVVRNADWQDSYSLWSATVRDAPRCARARNNLALALEGEGQDAEAEREYRRALDIMPADPFTRNNLGALCLAQGRLEEARRYLRAAVDSWPRYPEGLSNLGAAERELGHLVESERLLRQALAERPGHRSALVHLGLTLRRLGPGRHAEAEGLYRAILAEDPGDVAVQNNLGALLLEMGRTREAIAAFERVVRAQPRVGRGFMNLARAWKAAGRPRKSEESLVRAAVLDSGSGPFQLECARMALDLGRPELARRLYRKAVERSAADPAFAARLAR